MRCSAALLRRGAARRAARVEAAALPVRPARALAPRRDRGRHPAGGQQPPRSRRVAEDFGVPYHHLPVTPETRPQQEAACSPLLEQDASTSSCWRATCRSSATSFVARYPKRIINIHHSFLPAFAGGRPVPPGARAGREDHRRDRALRRPPSSTRGRSSTRTWCGSATATRSRPRAQGPRPREGGAGARGRAAPAAPRPRLRQQDRRVRLGGRLAAGGRHEAVVEGEDHGGRPVAERELFAGHVPEVALHGRFADE